MTGILGEIAGELAHRYITPYTARLSQTRLIPTSAKEVHDPVWGTITLSPVEVAIVDSPLVQRLRHLRQLGVAHWVYPGANHSRFEHTLGVLHQAQQLMSAVNRSSSAKYDEQVISAEDQDVIRLAALMHDTGHPFFSHVSEYALTLDAKTLLEIQRTRQASGEDVKISEIIAAEVVRSREFRKLLSLIFEAHAAKGLRTNIWGPRVDEFVDRAASAILGQPISKSAPLLHEIISGPYDADKLDYMIRDSKAAGIPTIIDISRLLQKLTVRKVHTNELPRLIAKRIKATSRPCYMFGFTWSGLSAVDELLLARLILYAKIYRHPKVVALEAMTQVFIKQISKLLPPNQLVRFLYNVCDDELLLGDRADLIRKIPLRATDARLPANKKAVDTAFEIVRRLRERDLFVRAFAFYPGDRAKPINEETRDPFAILAMRISNRDLIEEFRQKVIVETKAIMKVIVADCEKLESYKSADEFITINRVKPPSQEELRRAYIFPSAGTPITFGESGIHKDAWSSSFVSAAPKGYIFCPREIALYVYAATEVVIAREFDVAIPDWMMEEARQSRDEITELKRELRRRGYYSGKPRCVRPLAERLFMSDADSEAEAFASRFSIVQESVTKAIDGAEAQLPLQVLKQRALDWLDQFDDPELIDCGLEILKRSKLLDRKEIVGALASFLKEFPEFSSASVVPLSDGNDSSQIIQYYAADIGSLAFFGSLSDAMEADRNEPLLFVDDFIGSGGQIRHLLGSWFDEASLKKDDLNEQHELKLKPELDFLASKRMAFVFTAGWQAGVRALEEALQKLTLDGLVRAIVPESSLPFAFDNSGVSNPDAWKRFEQRCADIGRRALGELNSDWSPEEIDECVLGYGNRAMLLFFPYNAPSQTLTCMWAGSAPLVRRRKKKNPK